MSVTSTLKRSKGYVRGEGRLRVEMKKEIRSSL